MVIPIFPHIGQLINLCWSLLLFPIREGIIYKNRGPSKICHRNYRHVASPSRCQHVLFHCLRTPLHCCSALCRSVWVTFLEASRYRMALQYIHYASLSKLSCQSATVNDILDYGAKYRLCLNVSKAKLDTFPNLIVKCSHYHTRSAPQFSKNYFFN